MQSSLRSGIEMVFSKRHFFFGKCFLLLPLIMITVSTTVGAAEPDFVLPVEQFNCLVENRGVYESIADDPLFIDVESCPKIPSSDPTLSDVIADGFDPEIVETEFDTFIYLDKVKLYCLLSRMADPNSKSVEMFVDKCEISVVPKP